MHSWVIPYSDVYSFRIGKDLGTRLYSCRSFKEACDFVKLLVPYRTNVCDLIFILSYMPHGKKCLKVILYYKDIYSFSLLLKVLHAMLVGATLLYRIPEIGSSLSHFVNLEC